MLEKTTIARPYAQAVYELAEESGTVEQWSTQLDLLSRIVSDSQMQVLFNNPKVSHQQLQDLVIDIAGDALSDQARNFVKILVAASRLQ